jgi:hypothetical protein
MTTIATLKKSLTPGVRLRITNHLRPHTSRDTRVHSKTNTVALYTWALDLTGKLVPSRLDWPKAKQLRGDDNPEVFHYDNADGSPFLTVEIIGPDHPEAEYWPHSVRPHNTERV